MRRKLINWEALDRIQKDSLSAAEHELQEASDVLATTLGIDQLDLSCFGGSDVVYETLDGSYVRADYDLSKDHLTFENIEELVVDDESAEAEGRRRIADMLEAILADDDARASQVFGEYMASPLVRKGLLEGRTPGTVRDRAEAIRAGKSKSKNRRAHSALFRQRKGKLDAAGKVHNKPRLKRGSFGSALKDSGYMKRYYKERGKKLGRKVINAKGGVEKKRFMKECSSLSENVLEFVAYRELGPVLREASVRRDEHGNVVAVRVPTARLRLENQVISLNYRHMLDNDVKVVREHASGLSRDPLFCKAVAVLKRNNNISDQAALEESLNDLIGQWPSVLYLTQTELARTVKESLESAGVSNYDDRTCDFMAEAILMTAHDVFQDKVEKIMRLASADVSESKSYPKFQEAAHRFFPTVDSDFAVEAKVFSDLFDAVNEVWEFASRGGDAAVAKDAEDILEELSAVVNGDAKSDLGLASDVAEWLHHFAESNLEGGDWQVSNTPHQTVNGDHPAMAEKARKGYAPASDFGADAEAWHSRATERQFTGQQWTSAGGGEVFPSLHNPYVPKPFGDYTMKGEKGADKDWGSGDGAWQSKDTWPDLQNPYVPKGETAKSYKMKNGPGTDLVVDK